MNVNHRTMGKIPIQVKAYNGTDKATTSLLAQINGVRTQESILAQYTNNDIQLTSVFSALCKSGVVGYLDDWSLLRWCHGCDVPVLSDQCGCGKTLSKKIQLKLPSNPKLIDVLHANILHQLGISSTDNMAINVFIESGVKGFELIYKTVIGEFKYDDNKQEWQVVHYLDPLMGKANLVPLVSIDTNRRCSDSYKTVFTANAGRIKYLENQAVTTIREELSKYTDNEDPVLYFSGGKDSTVILDLAQKALQHFRHLKLRVIHLDTGMDFDETKRYVRETVEKYDNIEFINIDNGNLFKDIMEKLGPPSEDNAWCCPQLMGLPVNKLLNRMFPNQEYLAIEGPRMRETADRITYEEEGSGVYYYRKTINGRGNELTLRPIWYWTEFDVWLYMYAHQLEYHSNYDQGHQRVCCYMCPIHSNDETKISRHHSAKQWDEFDEILTTWQSRLGLPDEWIGSNLWKKDLPNTQQMRELGITSKMPAVAKSLNHIHYGDQATLDASLVTTVGRVEKNFSVEKLSEYLRVVLEGSVDYRADEILIQMDVSTIVIQQEKIAVTATNRYALNTVKARVSDLINIYFNCIGCKLCEDACGCLKIEDNNQIIATDTANCSCGTCSSILNLCPVSRLKITSIAHLMRGRRAKATSEKMPEQTVWMQHVKK